MVLPAGLIGVCFEGFHTAFQYFKMFGFRLSFYP